MNYHKDLQDKLANQQCPAEKQQSFQVYLRVLDHPE